MKASDKISTILLVILRSNRRQHDWVWDCHLNHRQMISARPSLYLKEFLEAGAIVNVHDRNP